MTARTGTKATIHDPLLACLSLPFHHVLFPFGFPIQIKSNDLGIIRIAEQSWGAFRPRFRESPVELRFLINDCRTRYRARPPIFRAQSNLLCAVADACNYACCDLAAGFGFACISKAAANNREYVRYHFLEAMAYTLLDAKHVVTLHAACVVHAGRGVLFVGNSGAGKSSLAYACARRGWIYVSDDSASIPRRRTGRLVVGNPQTFRFRPSASVLFPELEARVKIRNGKPTMEIRTERLHHVKTARECMVDYIVFLNRAQQQDGSARVDRLSHTEAFRRLSQQNAWPAELFIEEERLHAIERLLSAELIELTYSEFDPAIDLLGDLVHQGKC